MLQLKLKFKQLCTVETSCVIFSWKRLPNQNISHGRIETWGQGGMPLPFFSVIFSIILKELSLTEKVSI